MSKLQLPLKWHGGKGAFNCALAKWIVSLLPAHTTYVEPFFGGGSVLLSKPIYQDTNEIVNDLHGELSNFWRVLATTPDRMIRELWGTPFSEVAWNDWEAALADSDPVRRATAFFVRIRQSRQGLGKGFATLSMNRTRGGMNEQASAWWSAVEGLPELHYRLKRVVVLNQDFRKVIATTDSTGTCFYLDPPYLHETRTTVDSYEYEMTREQHVALLNMCVDMQGNFLLSGYRSDLYDSFAAKAGWCRHEYTIANNASSKSEKDLKTECLWTNFSRQL